MKTFTTITFIIAVVGLLAECEHMGIIPFVSIKASSLLLAFLSWIYCKQHLIDNAEKFNRWIGSKIL